MRIANPTISLRMVESKTRKAAFLREVVRQLQLERTAIESSRFEELLARPELHEAADVVTLRAVKVEKKTLMGLQAFLKPGGSLLLFRAASAGDAELANPMLVWQVNHPLLLALHSELGRGSTFTVSVAADLADEPPLTFDLPADPPVTSARDLMARPGVV